MEWSRKIWSDRKDTFILSDDWDDQNDRRLSPETPPLKSAIVFGLFAKHGQKFLFRGEPRNVAEDHAPPLFEAIEMIIMETKLVNYLVIFLMNNKTIIKFGFCIMWRIMLLSTSICIFFHIILSLIQ